MRFVRFVTFAGAAVVALAAPAAQAHHVGPFVGEWRNEDPATRQTTRYVVDVSGADLVIRGYGACVPTDCDWSEGGGPRTTPQADADDGRLTVTWSFGFKTQRDDLTLTSDGRLRADQFHDYAEGDPRPDRASTEYFVRVTPPRSFARVALTIAGSGAVSSDPAGISCPQACSLELEVGTRITLRAAPVEQARFRAWGGACAGAAPSCTLTVGGDTSISATFVPNPNCVVPRLVRKTIGAARALLARAHCRLGTISRAYSARIAKGRIVRQRPAAGTRLANGARVAVVVSRGVR